MQREAFIQTPKTIFILTGPTGVGKSQLLYSLPPELPLEIINADSRQVYRYMKIGTALPSEAEQKKFPHHLFSFLDPGESFSAGQFAKKCKELINGLLSKNKIPFIVGGTFFYIRALWDGLMDSVEISQEANERVKALCLEDAYLLLKQRDPKRAAEISSSDDYRIRRSLLINLSTGTTLSEFEKKGGIYSQYQFKAYYLDMDRALLYERINKRVENMFKEGLLEEFYALQDRGYGSEDPGLRSIGYQELFLIQKKFGLKNKEWPEQAQKEAISVISQASRRFAKRQLTWFRNESRLKRIDHVHALSLISDIREQLPK